MTDSGECAAGDSTPQGRTFMRRTPSQHPVREDRLHFDDVVYAIRVHIAADGYASGWECESCGVAGCSAASDATCDEAVATAIDDLREHHFVRHTLFSAGGARLRSTV